MKKSFISVLMVIALLFTGIVSPIGTNQATAFTEEKKPEEIVLDFSFFKLDYASDPEKYHNAAKTFFGDFETLAQFLMDCDMSDVDIYAKCATAIRWNDICDYTSNQNYMTQLYDYIDNYDGYTSSASSGLEYIQYFSDNYEDRFDQAIVNQINDLFKAASECDKSQYNLALKYYNKIIKMCDAFMIIAEGHKGATEKKAEAQKCIDNVMKSVDSKIFSSDVHKNNIGKVLFSKNNIVAGKETTSSFSTSYDANSNIYAIAYLSTPLQKIVPKASYYPNPNETCSASAYVKIDGVKFDYGSIKFNVDVQDYQANKAYVTFELLPNAKNTKGDNLKEWYDFVFSKLKSGKHTIEIEIAVDGTSVANGKFEIDWTNADLKKISKNVTNCIKISEDYRANKAQVPGVFKVKSKTYKDKTLSDSNIKTIFKKYYSDATSILKFVNVGDVTTGWGVQKDSYGYPVAKHSTMHTWVIYKAKDGWCYIVEFGLTCDYLGYGKYGNPYVYTVSKTKIAAKNVK